MLYARCGPSASPQQAAVIGPQLRPELSPEQEAAAEKVALLDQIARIAADADQLERQVR